MPSIAGRTVTARAPAKINLALHVGPRRPDGYHDLATVYQAVSLYDDVTAEAAEGFSVEVVGEESAGVPTDDRNLALRAARALAAAAGVDRGVALRVDKAIPVAGGLAGGSADAAAALVACDALWGTGLSRDDLLAIAADLGSDVPFLIVGGTALGTGRGEVLAPVLARGEQHWVIAVAEYGLATPDVYARLDSIRADTTVPPPEVDSEMLLALRAGDPRGLAPHLDNDLQRAAVACARALRATLAAGEEAGALAGLVSGSGPSCVFLARDDAHALDLAITLSSAGVCRTVRRVRGPVGGAALIG
jgi:4-diphosphocytidyl-2-C-methyl-D-erythritol kinase